MTGSLPSSLRPTDTNVRGLLGIFGRIDGMVCHFSAV